MRWLILLLSLAAFSKEMPLPPELDRVSSYGCTATHSKVPYDNTFWWHIRVNVVYNLGDKWANLYAVREGTDRKNALKDCERWMSRMEKVLRKSKQHYRELEIPKPDPESQSRQKGD